MVVFIGNRMHHLRFSWGDDSDWRNGTEKSTGLVVQKRERRYRQLETFLAANLECGSLGLRWQDMGTSSWGNCTHREREVEVSEDVGTTIKTKVSS
jgi:uncharacterized protein YndB with AHSA1/START domain